jgi:hypothetical protein
MPPIILNNGPLNPGPKPGQSNGGLLVASTNPPSPGPQGGFGTPVGQIPIIFNTFQQILGLVPIFTCSPDCRQGLNTADTIADDEAFTLQVFGFPTDPSQSYLNDTNMFLFSFPPGWDVVDNETFVLQRKSQQEDWSDASSYSLIDNTYGVLITTNNSCSYWGFIINWTRVLSLLGSGDYRFVLAGNNNGGREYCGFSPPFCLEEFDCIKADGSVKFETLNTGGITGDITTQGNTFSLCCGDVGTPAIPINWKDSIRFNAFFGYQSIGFRRESIKYATGVVTKVRDEAIKKFTLKTDNLPKWLLDRFAGYALQADELYVSDYNINNSDYNLKHLGVVASSEFNPNYTNYSRYNRILDLTFEEKTQSIFRSRCC